MENEVKNIEPKTSLELFIYEKFYPATSIGDADYTFTTEHFITVLSCNFQDLEVEVLSQLLQKMNFKQTLFDDEFVWLVNS